MLVKERMIQHLSLPITKNLTTPRGKTAYYYPGHIRYPVSIELALYSWCGKRVLINEIENFTLRG